MSAPGKQASSRWGSFLQQAVAGVESRLDTILAEDDRSATPPPAAAAAATTATTTTTTASPKVTSSGEWVIE